MRMIIVKIVMIDGDKIGVEINSKSCLNKLTLSKRVRPTGNQVTPIGPLEHWVGLASALLKYFHGNETVCQSRYKIKVLFSELRILKL